MAANDSLPNQAAIARELGISQQAVSKWKGHVPAEQVLAYSRATRWQVTPHMLRPDLYPYPADGLPPERRTGCECAAQGAI